MKNLLDGNNSVFKIGETYECLSPCSVAKPTLPLWTAGAPAPHICLFGLDPDLLPLKNPKQAVHPVESGGPFIKGWLGPIKKN